MGTYLILSPYFIVHHPFVLPPSAYHVQNGFCQNHGLFPGVINQYNPNILVGQLNNIKLKCKLTRGLTHGY